VAGGWGSVGEMFITKILTFAMCQVITQVSKVVCRFNWYRQNGRCAAVSNIIYSQISVEIETPCVFN